jgi:hypothetical protein
LEITTPIPPITIFIPVLDIGNRDAVRFGNSLTGIFTPDGITIADTLNISRWNWSLSCGAAHRLSYVLSALHAPVIGGE